ncbi:MAG: adenylate/guanylate cyclase domain-containing protein [Pirellulaceae bacterium]|nr:adenylate/guanylate cyclase domain-containing protein [Pirellulaceae bacterium]
MVDPSGARLTIRQPNRQYELPLRGRSSWTIGRNDDNQVVIKERWISRSQAMVQAMDNAEYVLIDLGSRNGTFVNGRRVTIPVQLANGDLITFGQSAAGQETVISFAGSKRIRHGSSWFGKAGEVDRSATIELSEQRLISVLVMDIRDFTRLTREMGESALSKMIGSWFREAGRIIQQHGSNVDKYIGDAVMAVWIHATNEPQGEDIFAICRALRDLWRMTQDVQSKYPVPFPLRIGVGVNTGNAVIGNKGTSDRPDYSPLGDCVNAAFRLESCTKEIQQDVAFGEVTYGWLLSMLDRPPAAFGKHQVSLKGYDGLTTTYACSFEALDNFLNQYDVGHDGLDRSTATGA